ncbi:CGNR zinc finger domain-containing protein [Rhodococcus sp. IEGM 1330]|uniref:CGNR zinc finger domain-containing protein n=1 Tax=Rhodococcus sp. IEGM 1330 TaxID=3082225 RepID=UPI0029529A2C|nr:CGNR zinc finger domain-containing protein [Rhodococcus sp. IEGM 1330]MDV8025280.1 CGNR zinc finger domain-containing protein [Rhodococcus sp. IEGM 1330]
MGWNWLGDHFALDVVNTVQLRRGTYAELISSATDLQDWAELQGARVPEVIPADAEVDTFRVTRDHILSLLRAVASNMDVPEESVEHIDDIARRHPVTRRIDLGDGRGVGHVVGTADPIESLRARAASAVIDLVNGPDRDRLVLCEAPRCGQLFLQDRPNQQWCCGACGNRARAARHHAVKKGRS